MLEELPGIGPITKFHLAKNIGLADVAKPDIWLERAAKLCRAASVKQLTTYLTEAIGESHHILDVAIWHYGVDGLLSGKDNKALERTRRKQVPLSAGLDVIDDEPPRP
ncbi:hypothetical protein EPO44_10645 [bacterium]|nr:MAG: hypothetical protein EPO44_10645 [bacterium]